MILIDPDRSTWRYDRMDSIYLFDCPFRLRPCGRIGTEGRCHCTANLTAFLHFSSLIRLSNTPTIKHGGVLVSLKCQRNRQSDARHVLKSSRSASPQALPAPSFAVWPTAA